MELVRTARMATFAAARLPAFGPTVPPLLSRPFGKPPARLSLLLLLLLLLAVGQLGRVSASPDAATDPTDDSMHGARVDKPDTLVSIIKTRLTLDVLLWDRTSGYYGGTE